MPRKTKAKSPAPEPAPEPANDPTPATRPKRAWSTYNKFVHDHYSDPHVQAAPVRQRLVIIGKMWQDQKKNMIE